MVSFDLSTTNIVLTVAVVGLFALFIILLVKLNPTKQEEETEESIETAAHVEKPASHETLPAMRQSTPDVQPPRVEIPRPVERQMVTERPLIAVSPTPSGPSVQTSQEAKTPATTYARQLARQAELSTQANRSGNSLNRKDCVHHFGYLRTFPKNSPIPDECFGCERIVDCLVNKNHAREKR